jgi:hypothetical protein
MLGEKRRLPRAEGGIPSLAQGPEIDDEARAGRKASQRVAVHDVPVVATIAHSVDGMKEHVVQTVSGPAGVIDALQHLP